MRKSIEKSECFYEKVTSAHKVRKSSAPRPGARMPSEKQLAMVEQSRDSTPMREKRLVTIKRSQKAHFSKHLKLISSQIMQQAQ